MKIVEYTQEEIDQAKQGLYNGASRVPDNRTGIVWAVREVGQTWSPRCSYTLLEAVHRLVMLMAEEPGKEFEIARVGWMGDRICWMYSMSNPDYVFCKKAERAHLRQVRSIPLDEQEEREQERRDRMEYLYVQHFDATRFIAGPK